MEAPDDPDALAIFKKYRGDGRDPEGKPAKTLDEKGAYLAHPDLVAAVNAALAVGQPLLVTGEAGTGKTMLAYSVAAELGLGEVLHFPVRSDHQGRDLLYRIDDLARFYDAQVGNLRARDRSLYRQWAALGQAFESATQRVVLIDEIDKAPRDFPSDLLHALDRMEIVIPELEERLPAQVRPFVLITSNHESQLPDAFLRRCLFYDIDFPDRERLEEILRQRLGDLSLSDLLVERVLQRFGDIRSRDRLQKKPATSELITWVRILLQAGVSAEQLQGPLEKTPFLGALIKVREDLRRLGGERQ